MEKQVRTTVTDSNGFVVGFKTETVEWNPPKVVHSGLSKSALAITNLQPGDSKRIVHGDLKCQIKPYTRNGKTISGRTCSLQPTIYKLRKKGWELEYYHEADHIMVIRRLK